MRERGSILVVLLLWVAAVTLAGLGLTHLLTEHTRQSALQLKLDGCVAELALDTHRLLGFLEASNARIRAERAVLVGAALVPVPPAVSVAARAALVAEETARAAALAAWHLGRAAFVTGRCGIAGALPLGIPALPWTLEPRDAIGPRPLRWVGAVPRERLVVRVFLKARNRFGGARIDVQKNRWHAQWAGPR